VRDIKHQMRRASSGRSSPWVIAISLTAAAGMREAAELALFGSWRRAPSGRDTKTLSGENKTANSSRVTGGVSREASNRSTSPRSSTGQVAVRGKATSQEGTTGRREDER